MESSSQKTLDFKQFDLAWAIFKVVCDDDGNPVDLMVANASKKYFEIVKDPDAIGKTFDMLAGEHIEKFTQQCYLAAYHREEFRDRLIVHKYGKWITYLLVQSNITGYCLFSFFEQDDLESHTKEVEESCNTADTVIACAKYLRTKEGFDVGINKVLSEIAKAIFPDRIFLIIINGSSAKVMYEWCKDNSLHSVRKMFESYSIQQLMEWKESLGCEKEAVVLEDIQSPENDSNQSLKILKDLGLSNAIYVPMYHQGKFVGFLGVANFSENNKIHAKDLLETIAFFIISEFVNNKLMGNLKMLSSMDLLTGVCNRNSMNSMESELANKEFPLGVLYVDVNGLKLTNDMEGHEAGDRLIKQTADILAKVFRRKEIYRAGGDEFVVLMPEIPKDIFENRLLAIEKEFKESKGVSVAMGSSWTEKAWNVQHVLREADGLMYKAKEEFYKRNGLVPRTQSSIINL